MRRTPTGAAGRGPAHPSSGVGNAEPWPFNSGKSASLGVFLVLDVVPYDEQGPPPQEPMK